MDNQEIIKNLLNKNIKSELYESSSDSVCVVFENDLFKKIESKSIFGKGLRVINNGRIGFSYCGGMDDSKLIQFATDNSKYGTEAKFDFTNNDIKNISGLYSKEVMDIPISTLKSIGSEIIEKIKKELPEYKVSVELEKEEINIKLLNSAGFNNSYRKSYYVVSFQVVRAKDDKIFFAGEGSASLDLNSNYKEKLDGLIEKCKLLKDENKIKSGNYPVIFSPKASRLLYGILLNAFNGKNVQKGASALSNKLGETLFSKNINISDVGDLANGISSCLFDGEGIPSKTTALIKEGRVENFIFDTLTASMMGVETTGNGKRGYSSVPHPGFNNIVIEPGDYSKEQLFSEIQDGIYVDEFIGGGQSNVMAGEFSVNLTLAFKIKNGKIDGSIKDTMLSGNVFNAFANSPLLGKDVFNTGNYITPYILLNDLSINS